MIDNSLPLILKQDDWPSSDLALWEASLVPGGYFNDSGVFETWSDGSRRFYAQQYGTWLSFILRRRPDLVDAAPNTRITKETVAAFVDEATERVGLRTIANVLLSLANLARGFYPGHDWQWLWRAAYRIYGRSEPTKLKPPIPVTAKDLFQWSLGRLAELEADPLPDPLANATQYRMALTVGLLIARPVRARAFVAMTVDDHVELGSDGITLAFSPADMKDKKGRRFPAPDALVPYLRRYIDIHRPILLQGTKTSALWISERGAPLCQDSFQSNLADLTRRVFGRALRPHAFRHIAATSIATYAPEHVGMIKDILGHATLRMAEQHYNRATAVEASAKLQDVWRQARGFGRSRSRKTRRTDP